MTALSIAGDIMTNSRIAAFSIPFAALGLLYGWARLRSELAGGDTPVVEQVIIEGQAKHLVTEEMARSSRAMEERIAPPFRAAGADGNTYDLDELRRGRPVVLTFVKDGCPCSESAQPFFNRLVDAHPGAQFLGVIDVGAEKAARWAARFRVSYPLLLDTGLEIVRGYGVENSAYVVLVDGRGRIRQHWPGYSAAMLQELGRRLAELTGTGERPIDVADAPQDPYSGCPFDL